MTAPPQTKKMSLAETLTNTAIGYSINQTAQIVLFPLVGIHVSYAVNFELGAMFTFISIARGFVLRRLFEWWRCQEDRAEGRFVGACALVFPSAPTLRLPDDSAARKGIPMASGLLDYFPDALAEVARLSKVGNDKHNPGQPLHWSRGKSNDHADTILRHMVDRGKMDADGFLHDVKVAWRALAQLQLALEARRK